MAAHRHASVSRRRGNFQMQERVRSIRHAASEVSAAARVDTGDRAR